MEEEEEGIGLADAERIVELNLSQIIERLHQTCTLSCCSTSVTCSTADEAGAFSNTHCSSRCTANINNERDSILNLSPLFINYRAEVLRAYYEDDPCCAENVEDIGGDMNHIHRVTLQVFYENNIRDSNNSKRTVTTVIVKTAPEEVLVCPLLKYYAW